MDYPAALQQMNAVMLSKAALTPADLTTISTCLTLTSPAYCIHMALSILKAHHLHSSNNVAARNEYLRIWYTHPGIVDGVLSVSISRAHDKVQYNTVPRNVPKRCTALSDFPKR